MPGPINRKLLHQRWLHSHEEDTPTEAVYRPASHPLPPARGRTGFELRADQTVTNVGIGPADRPDETMGSWSVDEQEGPTLHIRLDTGESQDLRIMAVEEDRLVVRKQSGE